MKTITHFSKELFSGGSPWAVRGLLCLAVALAYSNIWPNVFLFNDGIVIVQDKFLRHWSDLPDLLTHLSNAGYGRPDGFYRPVEMLIYFLMYQVFGPSAIAFHALNLSLHMLNVCLLYHFGCRIGLRPGGVFVATLLWALHPLHTDNVTYISSTSELLWGMFCLSGLLTLLPDFKPHKVWQAMIFFVLALGCKESTVVFPALAAATFFFVSKSRLQISAYVKMWPLWLLSACYIAIWLLFMHKTGYALNDVGDLNYTGSFVNRLLTSLATLPTYARLIVWPAGLHIEWFFPTFPTLLAWRPLAGVLMVSLCLLQIFSRGKSQRQSQQDLALSFGLLWFAVALSPYTGIITPVDAVINEGWLYVPLMGFFLGVTEMAAGFFEKKKFAVRPVVSFVVAALALSLGTATFLQNQIWRTPETLYQNNVKDQDWDRGERDYILGLFYLQRGDFDEAIAQFQDLVDHPEAGAASRLASTHMWLAMAWLHADIKNNMIMPEALDHALHSSPHIPEAISELGKALQESPDFYQVHKILSVIYRYQGNSVMAEFHDREAAEIQQKQGELKP
jgi:hypothetical protein